MKRLIWLIASIFILFGGCSKSTDTVAGAQGVQHITILPGGSALVSCTPQGGAQPVPTVLGGSAPVATGGNASTGGTPSTGGQAATGGTTAQSLEQQACANLLKLGCPEGAATNCAGIMAQRCSSPKVKCNTACLVSAPSKAVVQSTCKLACGAL